MYRGDVVPRSDGGMLEYYQGWFYKAEVKDSASGWAFVQCYYGLQTSAPSSSPEYRVSYELKGFKAAQCTMSGNNTANCAH
jgi:hypothetical protein